MIRTVVVLDNGVPDAAYDVLALDTKPGEEQARYSSWPTILSGGCEYGRVIADLFPEDSNHCFCSVEPKFNEITGWKPLVYSKILEGYRAVRPTAASSAEMPDDQLEALASGVCRTLGTLPRGGGHGASGWGRVVLLSSRFRRSADATKLGSVIEAAMARWNKMLRASTDRSHVPIHHCELICAAVQCGEEQTAVGAAETSRLGKLEHVHRSPTVSVASHTVNALHIVPFIHDMVQTVMSLRRVIITGLEMKLAGGISSLNEVALFCAQPNDPLVADTRMAAEPPVASTAGSVTSAARPLVLTKAAPIKQLKNKSGLLLPISAAYRITPVDVHALATTCFVKFLLTGNDTCLTIETRPATGSKKKEKALSRIQCTHILKEHGGAVFLHYLDGSHTLMESLPTIERCAGSGTATSEYRVQPMSDLLRKYTVKATPPAGSLPARSKLLLDTQFFPLCRSEGIIFEYPEFEVLVRAVVSDSMEWQAFEACQKLLVELNERRVANDEYCFGRVGSSHLGGIYSRVFEEVGLLTHAYRKVSPNHEKLAVLVAKAAVPKEAEGPRASSKDKERRAWGDVDKMARMTTREVADSNADDNNNAHFAKRRKGNGDRQPEQSEGQSDMLSEIQSFAADSSRAVLSLPRTLSASQRREAHLAAESLGLPHTSKGEGNDRYIVIMKEKAARSSVAGGASSLAGMKKVNATHKQDAKRFTGWS